MQQSESNSSPLNEKGSEKLHINYQLIKLAEVIQKEDCNTLAFNKESNLLAAGCGRKIRIMSFSIGYLSTIQIIDSHKDDVYTLLFLQSNYLISGGQDQSLIIWSLENQKWVCSQLIKKAHFDYISQIIANDEEDLLISCSGDASIKFWRKKDDWQSEQTVYLHSLMSISLNSSQNQLVSCGDDDYLQILYFDKKWKKKQTISLVNEGVRITFLGDDRIAYQPYNQGVLQIYQLNKETNLFQKTSPDIQFKECNQCSASFPQIYHKGKKILISKQGYSVYIIDVKNLTIHQTIDFKTYMISGALSEDGEYLVTWDSNNQMFQVFISQ